MRFVGVNAAGLKSKLFTFKKVINELRPSVFFVEESKFREEGKLKMDNYIIFEAVRDSREGGGLAIGCVRDLNPVLVSKGCDEVESISVEISVKKMKIRCCVAYGLQENSLIEKKAVFWNYLEEEVSTSWNMGSGFILQFDGNLWAGPEIIPGDPRPQNQNGKLFEEFLQRNPNLTVVNSLPICEGLITRIRQKEGKVEKSVLDFFVVCSRVLPYITKMVIDEERKFTLTNYKGVKKGTKATDSDHLTQYMDLNLQIASEKPVRKEIFNFKDVQSLNQFREITSNTNQFSDCFENDLSLVEQVKRWRTVLKSHCQTAFKKLRINKKKRTKALDPKISQLIDQRNLLVKNKNDPRYDEKLNYLENSISKMEAEENRNMLMEKFKKFSDNPEAINLQEMWKVLKTISPKFKTTVPIAKKNHKGDLVTNSKEISKLLVKEYKQRLRCRPMRPDLGDIKSRRNKIFKMQLKLARGNSSQRWKITDLEKALRGLKNHKSRDHEGYINEIFKPGVIGTDLKQSMLTMFNKLKTKKLIPSFMRYANITTVPKKGSLTILENMRGIFRVDIVRSILMRMVYNEKYPQIDKNMSDSQMGGRKGKGCRNNLFIINGIIHDVMKSRNMKPVQFQFSDYRQMFDGINLQVAISDMYEAGLKDDNLSLVYNANKEIFMAINTTEGQTERQVIVNSVLQGDTWGSLLASNQVDRIAQECNESGYGYKYKECLDVGMLGFVDDSVGITEAGYKAQMLNAVFNIKSAEKSLQFGVKKCKSMIVGKNIETILTTSLSVDEWSVEHVEDMKTGDTELVETYTGQVEIGKCSEQKYLGFLLSASGDYMTNIRSVRNKSIGIIRKIFEKLKILNLKMYYFECGVLFLNTMLRSSILYACETYYHLKETEIRTIERIEESYMRQLLGTTKGCPISQIYLELGQSPARYHIFKMRGLFFKYILHQEEKSMIFQFLKLQLEKPVRGDWASTCLKNLQDLGINLSLEEIREMSITRYSELIRIKCNESALRYLLNKRGKKGSEIQYSELEMSEYLLPNEKFDISEQKSVFAIRNKMTDIPSNFCSEEKNLSKCTCKTTENMEHIYYCKLLNKDKPELQFEEIFSKNLEKQRIVLSRFEENMEKRKEYQILSENETNEPNHGIQLDPLSSALLEHSNG